MSMETATLANGCFWCTEAVFKRLKGVESVMAGYTGGTVKDPSYQEVSAGSTGHAEALEIVFDPLVISFSTLLDVFFATHDPTTLNRQGNDVGTQYRSGIYYQSEAQKETAEAKIRQLTEEHAFDKQIVTEVTPFTEFFPADQSHRDFYDQNREYGYCRLVIDPKIKKLYKDFADKVKEGME